MYNLKSNLSEKQIEADIATYFGWISKGTPFRLLDVNEQLTGADKKYYNMGFSFYMQFKVSKGLNPISIIPASNRKGRSPLEDIREFRDEKGLGDDPTLYFKLREKAKNAVDFQHNILLGFANKKTSQAFYVAPLHLDKNNYYKCLFDSVNPFLPSPFSMKNIRLYSENWLSYIGFSPFLKEHVSIIPHEKVDTYKHFYSYSTTGCDIGWHSPELLNEHPSRLSDLLAHELNKCIDDNRFIDLFELDEGFVLPEDIRNDKNKFDINNSNFPIDSIQEKGKLLYAQHKIKMFTFLTNKEILLDIKKMFAEHQNSLNE